MSSSSNVKSGGSGSQSESQSGKDHGGVASLSSASASASGSVPTPTASTTATITASKPASAATPSSASTTSTTHTKSPRKRKATGVGSIKTSSISSKIPLFLSKQPKWSVTYFVMILEAILELTTLDRSKAGCFSIPAISKYMKGRHDELNDVAPKTFHAAITSAIQKATREGKLLKVRCSYKINKEWVQKGMAAYRAKENEKKLAERKKKREKEEVEKKKKKEKEAKAAALALAKKEKEKEKKEKAAKARLELEKKKKLEQQQKLEVQKKKLEQQQQHKDKHKQQKQLKQQQLQFSTSNANGRELTEEERQELELKKQQKLEAAKRKEDANQRMKEVEERIKKRRYPMDDLTLLWEDKAWNVKKPPGISRPPFLPYALTSLLPHNPSNSSHGSGSVGVGGSTTRPKSRPTTKKGTMTSVITACSTDIGRGSTGTGATSPITVMNTPSSSSSSSSLSIPLPSIPLPSCSNEYVNAGFGAGSRGLISDVFQIHHFFKGDMDYARLFPHTVPDFGISHLLHSVNEIVMGNAKKSKVVPPLLSYLFLLALNVLTTPQAEDWVESSTTSASGATGTASGANGTNDDETNQNRYARRWDDFKADCTKLNTTLTDCSWSETLLGYIHAMETFYTTDASLDQNALPGRTIVMEEYDVEEEQEEEENGGKGEKEKEEGDDADRKEDEDTDTESEDESDVNEHESDVNDNETEDEVMEEEDAASSSSSSNNNNEDEEGNNDDPLPSGYYGYLGPEHCAMRRAYHKLLRQDPWHLTAEELLSLLRALCDDILCMKPALAQEIAERDEKLWELLKAKKAAESHFRKIRLAHEGPKQKSKAKKVVVESSSNGDGSGGGGDGSTGTEAKEKKFVPTATKAQFEEATKMRDKAVAVYDKNVKLLVHRSKPIGYDRNYNPIYFFHHNPQSLYIEITKGVGVGMGMGMGTRIQCDPFHQTKSWHCIDSKQLFDDYVSSLDVRGVKESKLYERLVGESPSVSNSGSGSSSGGGGYSNTMYRRHLYSSNQKDSLMASRKREEEELERKWNNAMIANANAERSRRSGRLASNAKDEASRIQDEMQEAKLRFEAQLAALDTSDDAPTLCGITLLSEFERKYRLSLSARCSELWNSGSGDGDGSGGDTKKNPGIIGKIAKDMLEVEEICNGLSPWKGDNDDGNGYDDGEALRLKWRLNIEDTANAWHNGCTLHIGPKTKASDGNHNGNGPFSPSGSHSHSSSSSHKKQRLSLDGKSKATTSHASVSFEYALSTFKTPLIELEQRIYSILGLERAVQEVDEANEHMSVESNGTGTRKDNGNGRDNGRDGIHDEREAERRERANYAWKKKIWTLHGIPARRAAAIRDVLISAIAMARKAKMSDALEDLRAALQLHRPGGGGRARTAALAVLDKYGGFEWNEDDNGDEDDGEGDDGYGGTGSEVESMDGADANADESSKRTSFLSVEAMMLSGSLEGDDHADRVDWKDAVTACKTVSRFAALVAALKSRAMPRLEKLVKDKKTLARAIAHWETNGKTRKGKSKKNTSSSSHHHSKKFHSATEIWADVKPTDQFVTSKVQGFPWWPARVCIPLDSEIAQSLDSINRTLVSFIGEQHLYAVDKNTEMKPLDLDSNSNPNLDGDDTHGAEEYGPEVTKNLRNSINIAKRILRGRGMLTSSNENGDGDLSGMNVDIGGGGMHLEEKKSSS